MFDSENTLKEIEFLDRKEVEVLEWNSMNLSLPPTVYPPREDTQLLYDVLETFEPFGTSKLLEIGSGSGALSIAAAKRGWFVDACDINPYAVAATKYNAETANVSLNVTEGGIGPSTESLASIGIEPGGYDMVIWNMPYIPVEEVENQLLGPLEESALIDTHPEGLLKVFAKRMASNSLCKLNGISLLVCRGIIGWKRSLDILRQHGLAARVIKSTRFDNGEEIFVLASWIPFVECKHHIVGEIDSTNAEMLRGSYDVGDSLMARIQTNGRGRHGNQWEDHPKSFKCSWLIDAKNLVEISPLRQLHVAQEMHFALKFQEKHSEQMLVKWPNDLLVRVDEKNKWRKCGGILFQSQSKGEEQKLVLGIGINTQKENLSTGQGALTEIGIVETWTELFTILNAVVASLFEEKHPALVVKWIETYDSNSMLSECIYRNKLHRIVGVSSHHLTIQDEQGHLIDVEDDAGLEWINLHPQ